MPSPVGLEEIIADVEDIISERMEAMLGKPRTGDRVSLNSDRIHNFSPTMIVDKGTLIKFVDHLQARVRWDTGAEGVHHVRNLSKETT